MADAASTTNQLLELWRKQFEESTAAWARMVGQATPPPPAPTTAPVAPAPTPASPPRPAPAPTDAKPVKRFPDTAPGGK